MEFQLNFCWKKIHMTPSWFWPLFGFFFSNHYILNFSTTSSTTKRRRTFEKFIFWIFENNKVISVALWRRMFLAKNHLSKNFPPPGIVFERRIVRRRILLAKNTPSEESSGRRIFHPNKKNYCSEEFSGKESSEQRSFRRRISLAKKYPNILAKNSPGEEFSGEKSSSE
jgi:hypothetical protein